MAEGLRTAAVGGPNCLKRELEKIISDLKDEELREQYIQGGLIEALRDISTSDDCTICSSALNALSILVHDNMAAKLELLRPPGFFVKLINLCSAKNHDNTEETYAKSILCAHESATGLIRKLVLHPECMTQVASLDVIQHMIDISGIFFDDSKHINCCLGVPQFPPRATSYFHQLSYGRQLVGKVMELCPDVSRRIVGEYKHKVKEMLSIDPCLCVLSVDLYDTTTDKDIMISEELIKEGLAWPQFMTPEKQSMMYVKNKGKEKHTWADILVTSVIDGGHFWAQVGGEAVHEKLRTIKNILQSEDQPRLEMTPKLGDLVCVKTIIAGHQDLYRAKIVEVLPTDEGMMVEVFALDYGFKNVVSAECLRGLTASGLKEPFQTRFCCLSGVQAPPLCSLVVENAAGALRNLAYRSNACRLQILEKDGVDALLKLCRVPDKVVCMQAVGGILNLSINFKTRARIGYLGGIKILLDIIQRYLHRDVGLLCLAIGALRNLMLESPINRGRVADSDGLLILNHVYFTCTDANVKQQCLGALKNLVGNSWYLLTGNGGVDLRGIVDKKFSNAFSLADAIGPRARPPSVQRRARKLRPGEVEPKPIEKTLPSHVVKSTNSSCEESDKRGSSGLSQDENTDGDTDYGDEGLLIPSPISVRDAVGAADAQVNEECQAYYIQGELVPFCEDEVHELRESKSAKRLSSAVISRSGCAFLNAGKGGTVYLGVTKSRVVCGVEIGRKDRDRLRLGVDELLGDFKPPVRYDKYQVNFVPVAKQNGSRRTSIEFIRDVFVIEVVFQKTTGTVYSTNKRRCYFRCGTSNSEFSTQEIRKWVIREQESFYNNEIKSLKEELSEAKQKLAAERF